MSLLNKLFHFDFGYLDDPHAYRWLFERWAFEFTIKINNGVEVSWFYEYETDVPSSKYVQRIAGRIIEREVVGKSVYASSHFYPVSGVTEVIFEGARLVKKWYKTECGNDVVFQVEEPKYGFSIK